MPRATEVEVVERQIAEHVREHQDDAGMHDLWETVIMRARADTYYLRKMAGRADLAKHQKAKIRRINESPPVDFFEGEWFEEICEYLGLEPQEMRP